MGKRVGLWVRLGLILLAVVAVPLVPIRGQNFPGPAMYATGGGYLLYFNNQLPPPPPQGAWGEVIYSDARWLVVQNQVGQQFPISYASVPAASFLIRWPMRQSELPRQSLVEAIGQSRGSNVVMTDHIDVFEGPDARLVRPTYTSVLPNRQGTLLDGSAGNTLTVNNSSYFFGNNFLSWDPAAQSTLHGWAYPISPEEALASTMLHVVGNPVPGTNPLQLSVLGNNFVEIVPAGGTLTLTQVGLGSPSQVQKGDIAFLVPTDVTPQTLVLSQLVVLKKIPRSQYVP